MGDEITKNVLWILLIVEHNNHIQGVRETTDQLHQHMSVVQELTVNSGIFLWKLTNASKLLSSCKAGQIINSPGFFTHEEGYKLQLQLFPCGNTTAEVGHMSLFIRICNGPNDAELTWPFSNDLVFELLDMTGDGQHKTYRVAAGVCGSYCWKKPDRCPNTGLGQRNFMSHDELRKRYLSNLIDDTFYVRVHLGKWYVWLNANVYIWHMMVVFVYCYVAVKSHVVL